MRALRRRRQSGGGGGAMLLRPLGKLPRLLLAAACLAACPRLPTADGCADGTVAIEVTVSARRNSSGHWAVDAAASAGLDPEPQPTPELTLSARLSAPGCPGPGPGPALQLTARAELRRQPLAAYEQFPGLGRYRLVTAAATWSEAERRCRADGAHLIVVNSPAEADVVGEFFGRGIASDNAYNTYWLYVGFHDREQEGEYVTVLGGRVEESGYARWAPADGQWTAGADSNCGIMDKRLMLATHRCGVRRAFVCELPGK